MITLRKEMRPCCSYFNTGTVTARTYAPPSIDAALRSLKNSIYRGNLVVLIVESIFIVGILRHLDMSGYNEI